MEDYTPTYVFEDNQVVALYENVKIAAGETFSEVEKSALEYLDTLEKTHRQRVLESSKKAATHVATPNGLKGEILSRIPTVWGSEITVRLENGRIARFETHTEDDLVYSSERTASTESVIDAIRTDLDESYPHDKVSLARRIAKLTEIQQEIANSISKAAYADEVILHKMSLEADNEKLEIGEALAHLHQADTEAFAPPAPFNYGAAHQADLGKAGGDNWLDVVAAEMIAESEAQDFDKLLSEEPGLFTAALDTGALSDAGVIREMAYTHITSKTAGFTGEKIDEFRDAFVAQVEMTRRAELSDRQASTHKEAAAKEEALDDAPDAALFM